MKMTKEEERKMYDWAMGFMKWVGMLHLKV